MNGQVDNQGRAIVTVSVWPTDALSAEEIQVWIDTGFNGELVMPQQKIDRLGLNVSGTVKAILADGSEVTLRRYACHIDWFDERRELEVVANEGSFPLLGVGLLVERDLFISYRTGDVTIQ